LRQKKSVFNRTFIITNDLILISIIVYFIPDEEYANFHFLSYILIFWLSIAYYTKFYKVYRYTQVSILVSLVLSQFFIFSLAFLSYFTVFREGEIINNQVLLFSLIIGFITFFKFSIFFLLQKYRSEGNSYRNIVYFGNPSSSKKLEVLFHSKNKWGYRYFGFFSNNSVDSKKYLGHTKNGFKYIEQNEIDEIYCDSSEVNFDQLIKITKYAEEKKLQLRLLPKNKAIYSKDFILEYFGTTPILKPKPLPFEKIETHLSKRVFDIIISTFVCLFILSWLLPLLWVVISIDSKGPLFFKQKREGINGSQFLCYKLRSMKINNDADNVSASKYDARITKVGVFLRKTSLDEFPQFFNVFLGDMSIVGPRPHMNAHTKKYTNEVENYSLRHSVKPGITGLAQVSGYRGEVVKDSDIKNRVRLDIFYIENWSFFLDIKIIAKTFFNVFIKEEKAY
jgi:putative colanic acid biosynthesis UDP-glucose lipid carrier transferase